MLACEHEEDGYNLSGTEIFEYWNHRAVCLRMAVQQERRKLCRQANTPHQVL